MEFKVYHIMNKPIEPLHREAYTVEWKIRANELIADRPKATDTEAWQAINVQLDDLQQELQDKYPCTSRWNVESFKDLETLVSNYGTISFCMEDGKLVIYIMDLPEVQPVSPTFEFKEE